MKKNRRFTGYRAARTAPLSADQRRERAAAIADALLGVIRSRYHDAVIDGAGATYSVEHTRPGRDSDDHPARLAIYRTDTGRTVAGIVAATLYSRRAVWLDDRLVAPADRPAFRAAFAALR